MRVRTRRNHSLVRGYLRDLDMACAALPAMQSQELRQQIVAHLADALPRRASAYEVAAVLNRLGAPSDLAADAATDKPLQARGVIAVRRLGVRVRRAGWQTWVLSSLLAIGLIVGAVRLAAFLTAPLIHAGDGVGWYYGVDGSRATDSQADNASQTTAPIRSGKRQGLILNIYNPSDFTQTVLGLAPGSSPFGTPLQILVSEPNPEIDIGGMVPNAFYTLPETIPPHQFRAVIVKWTSTVCLVKGAEVGIDQVKLRVRLGWLDHTDTIPLFEGFYVSGPSAEPCGGGQ
jgi:hypothetical protein